MVADFSGKSILKNIRYQLMPYASRLVEEFQLAAGLNGGETAITHIYIRLFYDYCNFYSVAGSIHP